MDIPKYEDMLVSAAKSLDAMVAQRESASALHETPYMQSSCILLRADNAVLPKQTMDDILKGLTGVSTGGSPGYEFNMLAFDPCRVWASRDSLYLLNTFCSGAARPEVYSFAHQGTTSTFYNDILYKIFGLATVHGADDIYCFNVSMDLRRRLAKVCSEMKTILADDALLQALRPQPAAE